MTRRARVRPSIRLLPEDAAAMLEGLVQVDLQQMRRVGLGRPRVLRLIRSGRIRYSDDDPTERWQTYLDLLASIKRDGVAYADCEDLASAVAAELRLDGHTDARTYVYATGPRTAHVVVILPTKQRAIDPSKLAGML